MKKKKARPREPKLPVVMFGNLTDREHRIVEARKFQNAEIAANTNPHVFVPSEAFSVIAGLLSTFDYDELVAAYKKAGIP